MADAEKVTCRTPTVGRSGATNIPKWKYDAIRTAIIACLTDAGEEGVAFSDLSAAVAARLSDDQLKNLGSVGWHTTTVKLNMEYEGEITRCAGVSPQRLILA